jgi:membrane associated rhomboid family serine protease
MFLPLHDGVPLRHLKAPLVTRGLIGANVAAYALVVLGVLPLGEQWIVAGFGVVPAVLFGTEALPEGLPFVPAPLTLITSLFLHGSALHLIGNMLFLSVFGDNVEDGMGHRRFIAFYLVCGVVAGLSHAFMQPESTRPLIGASGAVAGVVAAYLILYPRVKVWGLFFGRIPLRVPALWAIGFCVPLLRRRYDPVLARMEATETRG